MGAMQYNQGMNIIYIVCANALGVSVCEPNMGAREPDMSVCEPNMGVREPDMNRMVCEDGDTYHVKSDSALKTTLKPKAGAKSKANSDITSHPFNDVFKTLKTEHTRLFIPIINAAFGTDYAQDEDITLLPTEGIFIVDTPEGTAELTERITDFLVKVRGKCYLIECQSSNDGSMVVRLAEYAFLSAIRNAEVNDGVYEITMPNYSVLYVRTTGTTPRETRMRFVFPNGQKVDYNAPNIFMTDYTREQIVEQKLYALIPFYILRYDKAIKTQSADIEQIVDDLQYFRSALAYEFENGTINGTDESDIRILTNTIIGHLFGNKKDERRERMVNVMGGNVIYTEALRLRDEGRVEGRAESLYQLSEAQKLLRTGTCNTIEELVSCNIDRDIAEIAVSFL